MLTIAFILSFVICFLLTSIGIYYLKKRKLGQAIRKEGPERHKIKSGTPNIGGVFIILSVIISFIVISFLYKINVNYELIFMLFMPLICYGILGFLDDYLKAKKKTNDGISPSFKMLFQIIWAVLYFIIFLNYETSIINIFGYSVDLKWFYGVFILFLFVSSSNAFNLCDGLDGLASGMAIIIFIALLLLSKNEIVSLFVVLIIAALLCFWVFNVHPASIFMGDSGSLALGATIANLCIILKVEFLLVIFGLMMILETLSVIIQVIYFKISKGKRIFLMTPIHHHFELKGIKEEKISIGFWICEVICVIIGLLLYKALW